MVKRAYIRYCSMYNCLASSYRCIKITKCRRLFKKNIENNYINVSEKTNNNQLIERKKSFFTKFKSFVLKMLNITKN